MRVPLEPPAGLIDDDTTFAAPGVWADSSNIRFVKGRPETIGPWNAAELTVTGTCRNIRVWTDHYGAQFLAFGTHSKLQVHWNGALSDITPVGLTAGSSDSSGSGPGYGTGTYGSGTYSFPTSQAYARTWSFDTWGVNLVANPRGGAIYRWENSPSTPAAVVTNAPDEVMSILVTPQRQVLAFGCNEEGSGNFNALCIRGSDLEDIDTWTTLATNNAFEHILEGSGRIISARMIGPFVAVWTNVGLYIGEFIGVPGQAYRFDPVAMDCGLIAPNAVQIVGQTAFWIGPDRQFRTWSPGARPTIMDCPIWHDFADNLDEAQADKIIAAQLSKFNEVWFHYPDLRDSAPPSENSRYLAFSADKGAWFRGQIARTAFVDAGVAGYPIAADPDGVIWYHEHPDGDAVGWRLKTADSYVEEAERVVELQRFVPDFEEQANSLSLLLSMRKDPRSNPYTKGPYEIPPSAARKDFRVSGRIMSLEITGSGRMRMGKPMFEAVLRGVR